MNKYVYTDVMETKIDMTDGSVVSKRFWTIDDCEYIVLDANGTLIENNDIIFWSHDEVVELCRTRNDIGLIINTLNVTLPEWSF